MKLAIAIDKYVDLKRQSGYEFEGGQKLLAAFSRSLGDTDLGHITSRRVSEYLDESDSALVHWHFKYRILHRFFTYWAGGGTIPGLAMPVKKPRVRPTFVPYIFSRYQLSGLLKAAKRCQHHKNNIDSQTMRTLLLLLYGTGASLTEVVELLYRDVDIAESTITIRGRGARYRQIPIGESLAEVLRKYVRWRTRQKFLSGSFLVTKYDQPIRRPIAAKYFEKIRKSAGVLRMDGASFQPRLTDLKCTFAVHRITSWIKNGADLNRMLPALAAYMGQTGLGSTGRYLALTPVRFQKQPDKLSPERRKYHWRNNQTTMEFLSSL